MEKALTNCTSKGTSTQFIILTVKGLMAGRVYRTRTEDKKDKVG